VRRPRRLGTAVQDTIKDFAVGLYRRYAAAGPPHPKAGPEPGEGGARFPPPAFNLCSALHHACGGAAFVHECCNGVRTAPYPRVTHEQILDVQLPLHDELFRYAVGHPVRWVP
jgi:hypothetical protein